MGNFLLAIQMFLLVLQITLLIVGIKKKADFFEFAYGYVVWACIPITLLGLLVNNLS